MASLTIQRSLIQELQLTQRLQTLKFCSTSDSRISVTTAVSYFTFCSCLVHLPIERKISQEKARRCLVAVRERETTNY